MPRKVNIDPSITRTPGIYKLTETSTGKIYIGQSTNMRIRYSEHRSYYYRRIGTTVTGTHTKEYVDTHTFEEAYTFEVLEQAKSVRDLNALEIKWIAKLHATDESIGLNRNPGGSAGFELKAKNPFKSTPKSLDVPVFMYNVDAKRLTVYTSHKTCADDLDTTISNIRSCAEKCHIMRRVNYIFYMDFRRRSIVTINYMKHRIETNLKRIAEGNPRNEINYNARVNSTFNYACAYARAAIEAEKIIASLGFESSEDYIATLESLIAECEANKLDYQDIVEQERRRENFKRAKELGEILPDNEHRGKSIFVYDWKARKLSAFVNFPAAAKYYGVDYKNLGSAFNENRCVQERYYLYSPNKEIRDRKMHENRTKKRNTGSTFNVYAYMCGYLLVEEYCKLNNIK